MRNPVLRMPATSPVIAIVDDEPQMRTALGRLLRVRGYDTASFGDGSLFLNALQTDSFACVILDLHMPEPNGFTVLERLSERPAAPPVIVISGHDKPGNAERVTLLGASAYLTKPVDEGPLLQAIDSAVNARAGQSNATN